MEGWDRSLAMPETPIARLIELNCALCTPDVRERAHITAPFDLRDRGQLLPDAPTEGLDTPITEMASA